MQSGWAAGCGVVLSNEDLPEASLVPHLHLDRREHIHLRSVVLLNSSRLLVQPELVTL